MEFVIPNTQHPISSIKNLLQQTRTRLIPHTDTPSLDAQVLLAHITGKPRAWLLAHPEVSLTAEQNSQLELELQKLESGLPLPYVLGEWEFFGLKFKVTPDVLIPRPETELLVETALDWINKQFLPQRRAGYEVKIQDHALHLRGHKAEDPIWVADIGTGSGCIAVTLAVHCPDLHLLATDISPAALTIAQYNAKKHNVADRITFLQADLLDLQFPIPNLQSQLSDHRSPITNLSLITANLPYIPTSPLRTLEVDGREPALALDGGPDGLSLIRSLIRQLLSHVTPLAPGGLILLEIEARQGASASALARQHFPNAHIHVKSDLAGYDRLLSIQT